MKKIVAIPLLLMILFTGININIATHYCSGNFSGSRVSLSDKTAGCGMNDESDKSSSIEILKKHCCENVITSFAISKNYFPVSGTTLPQYQPQVRAIHEPVTGVIPKETAGFADYSGDRSPPGRFCSSSVEQETVCNFLI